jgi:hydrogenase maturation protease
MKNRHGPPPSPDPQSQTPSILIVGIGSPFGDDAAGLEAARRLVSAALLGARVTAADRPGVDLLDMLDGADAVILIDAVRSGGLPGKIHDLDLADVSALSPALVSSHGLGVGEAIELARRLGRLPARARLLGIEVSDRGKGIDQPLSDPISAAVDRVVRRAGKWATRFATEIASFPDRRSSR